MHSHVPSLQSPQNELSAEGARPARRDSDRSQTDLTPLLEPITLGSRRLANRLAHPAILGNYGDNGRPTGDQIAYYRRRAAGGVGLIITEGVSVHPTSLPHPSVIHAYDPAAHAGLRKLADAVHAHDVPVLLQLWHVGRQQLWSANRNTWGVSPLPDPLSNTNPHVMSRGEIRTLISSFVETADLAERLGFDGVEVHGAHGYLITQMLSPWTNTRDDEYGTDFSGRLLFLREILEGIRQTCSSSFILGLKLSGSEFVNGGLTASDTAAIMSNLASRTLVDVYSIGQGNFSLSLEKHVPDMHFPEAPFAALIADLRKAAAGVPVMALGRIIEARLAAQLVENGTADLIGMGRALISDPDLPRKAFGGHAEPIRRCISCNVCWDAIARGDRLTCIHNANVTKAPRASRRRPKMEIQVVGGGPAGMECAWVAASRGHRVILSEKTANLGGQVRSLCATHGLGEFGHILDYQEHQLGTHRVDVRLESPVNREHIEDTPNTNIVIAAGSSSAPPPPDLEALSPWSPHDARWAHLSTLEPAHALVIDEDGGYYAYSPVVRLVEAGWEVTIASTRTDIGWNLDYLSRIGMHRYVREASVGLLTGVSVSGAPDGKVALEDVFNAGPSISLNPSLLVWAGHRVSCGLAPADFTNARVHIIGDAYAPRDIRTAIMEGSNLGYEL